MRIEQLYYLVEIAHCGSISMASERLHLSQPSISQAICNLEKEFGIKLFSRSKKGIRLTEKGEAFVKKSMEILAKIDELKMDAADDLPSLTGNLSISVIPSAFLTFLPKTLSIYKQKYPRVNLKISEDGSFKVIEDVKTGKADLGVIAVPKVLPERDVIIETLENEQINFQAILYDEVVACAGKSSPLSIYQTISLEEIVKHPIVTFKPGYSMYYFITKRLKKFGEPNVLLSTDNTEATKRMIAEGIAIGFYTKSSLKDDPYVLSSQIVPLPIKNEIIGFSYGLIYSRRHHLPLAGVRFMNKLSAYCRQLAQDLEAAERLPGECGQ